MCFSATASFVAGGALCAVGAATMSYAKREELPLATIPLIFGIQQIIDGVVWISSGVPIVHAIAIYAYALLAFVLWPVFVPFALLSIERDKVRRGVLEAIALVGFGLGLFFLHLITSGVVTAKVVNHCVAYYVPHPYLFAQLAFYLIATAGPFLVVKKEILNIFGTVLLVSFAVAGWFYIETFSSTWCFFAAILSGIMYWYVRSRRI